jgi:hypothetical protein
MTIKDKDSCYKPGPNGQKCMWENRSKPVNQPTPLFTKEFCHPIKKADGTKMLPVDWSMCITKKSKDECD